MPSLWTILRANCLIKVSTLNISVPKRLDRFYSLPSSQSLPCYLFKSNFHSFRHLVCLFKCSIIYSSLPSSLHNLVVVARQQTRAQGNNKNEWLSPLGCCVFTLYLNLNTNDFSPTRLCLLQFAAALSCVQSVLRTPGYEVAQ